MLSSLINKNIVFRNISVIVYYFFIKKWYKIKRLFIKTSNKYVFIFCPPYCGSTLLTELLDTSCNVSVNNSIATKEGQQLPELKEMMFYDIERWNSEKEYDWNYIKNIWLSYWDLTKPLLMEKSPPNIIRGTHIQQQFQPAYFIIMVRDPYAHCEGLMRRNNWDASTSALFSINCLRAQMQNHESLLKNVLIRYEDLVENPDSCINKIINLIPEFSDVKVKTHFKAHNFKKEKMGLKNLNQDKISKFSKADLEAINNVFVQHELVLNYFHYQLIRN